MSNDCLIYRQLTEIIGSKVMLSKGNNSDKTTVKNIKNIYVHKINSLMKISRDSLAENEADIVTRTGVSKKIKKNYSEIEKTSLKLQKNRESARKARQRKNLYIKLLQSQVGDLKKQLAESEQISLESTKYLNSLKNQPIFAPKQAYRQTEEDDLDMYLSHERLPNLQQFRQLNNRKLEALKATASQYQQWYSPDILKYILNLKKQEGKQLHDKMIEVETQNQRSDLFRLDQGSITFMLALQQRVPATKITNLVRFLNKNSEHMKTLLDELQRVHKDLEQLILSQEVPDSENAQYIRNSIRGILDELDLCAVGDSEEKIVERCLRWAQFRTINMDEAMSKIIRFDNFVQKIDAMPAIQYYEPSEPSIRND